MALPGQYGPAVEHIRQYVRESERVVHIDELQLVFCTDGHCEDCSVLTPVALRVTLHRMAVRGQIERLGRGRYWPAS